MIRPNHYELRIEPDLDNLTFEGKAVIQIQTDAPLDEIILNAVDLNIKDCSIKRPTGIEMCIFQLEPQFQTVVIKIPQVITETFCLSISYSGIINDQYVGLFHSKYQHNGQEKIIASTQFEASDARRAFPCFDRPDMKATFDIEFVIDPHLTGISNTAIREERYLASGKKRVRFEPTPKMSTYLVFFGFGEFEFLEDDSEQPLMRVATTAGKTEFGHYALDMARKSLQFGAQYLRVPYPLSKCDYIAVPDSMGAMENFGAIRHAEDILLVYPRVTSKSRETLITKIIAHEGIHMWFGDLVSPAAWKYLWLNESFATYFTYVIPHHFYPKWGVWDQFFHERLLSGMERDSLASTISIDLPNVDDPNANPAPTPSTAPIVYNKGAAVIRMLAAYLGEDAFRQALHDFLIEYQFDSASSAQFWAAVAHSSGVPLQDFAQTWIYQPGHPLITVAQSGSVLTLTQRRFCYSEIDAEYTWVIPVDLEFYQSDGSTQSKQVVFENEYLEIDIPKDTRAYKLNAGFTGFYRVSYPTENWEQLGKLIKSQKLSATDSLNVLDDLFALLKAGQYTEDAFLDFIEDYCSIENRYLPLTNLAKNLGHIYQLSSHQRQRISALGLPIFERALDQMDWIPQDNEPLVITELRETLLWAAFVLNSARVAKFVNPQFKRYLKGDALHKDTVGTILKIGAATNAEEWAYLWAIAADTERTEAERIVVLEALGHHPERTQLLELLEKNLTEIPTSLQSHLIQACAQSRIGPDFLWDWFCEKLPKIETWPLPVVERLIVGLVPLCGLGRSEEISQVLAEFLTRHPNAIDSVRMALELLTVNEQLRRN